MKIEEKDILGFNFFQYGSPYIGECGVKVEHDKLVFHAVSFCVQR